MEPSDPILSQTVLAYLAAVYGVLVGVLLPLLYLHGRVYFKRREFRIAVLFGYLGRLGIILLLYLILVGIVIQTVEGFGSPGDLERMIESRWYIVGAIAGLLVGIAFSVVGLRRAREHRRPPA